MDEKKFKKKFRNAACTNQPWKHLIPKENRNVILRKIKQETIEAYGYSMDECPKRKTCLKKKCIGRPLPWKSKTAKPYLEQLKKEQNIKEGELFLSNCDTCPIANKCKSPCAQVNDFLSRQKQKQPSLAYKETVENFDVGHKSIEQDKIPLNNKDIPWDAISDKRKKVIEKYLYERKDFLTLANELGLNNQAYAKYEFYAALTKLSEVAVMRKWFNENATEDWQYKSNSEAYRLGIIYDVYFKNMTFTAAAQERNVTKQAIQQIVSRIQKINNIKWNKYVRKEGSKVIYNTSELFK